MSSKRHPEELNAEAVKQLAAASNKPLMPKKDNRAPTDSVAAKNEPDVRVSLSRTALKERRDAVWRKALDVREARTRGRDNVQLGVLRDYFAEMSKGALGKALSFMPAGFRKQVQEQVDRLMEEAPPPERWEADPAKRRRFTKE